VDVSRESAKPASAKAHPDQQADRRDHQANDKQHFAGFVHGNQDIATTPFFQSDAQRFPRTAQKYAIDWRSNSAERGLPFPLAVGMQKKVGQASRLPSRATGFVGSSDIAGHY